MAIVLFSYYYLDEKGIFFNFASNLKYFVMLKKYLLIIAAALFGSLAAVEAKINYVPLYLVVTQTDSTDATQTLANTLFVTQDDHKFILPESEDSLTFMLFKGDESVYAVPCKRSQPVYLPTTIDGDYEVRLCADNYYYYGYVTLDKRISGQDSIPTENTNWENIKLLGSDTPQQFILDNILGLHVVEYTMKPNSGMSEEDLSYLSEEEREAYIQHLEQMNEEMRSKLRYGLLPEELKAIFPSLVVKIPDGFGINYTDLIPILISCIQELKVQIDSRTEKFVDVMMARSNDATDVGSVRSIMGNTLISAVPSSVNEPATVRYLLAEDVSNAYLLVTNMAGRVMTRVPLSPADTSATIDSSILDKGIFLCTMFVNGEVVETKRLVKTK